MVAINKIITCKNKFNGRIFQAIQNNYTNYDEIKEFINKNQKLSVRVIQPSICICNLEYDDSESIVNLGDWVIRSEDAKIVYSPFYHVITEEIMQSNFDFL